MSNQNELMHSKGPWKDHEYVSKHKSKSGKWVYVYKALKVLSDAANPAKTTAKAAKVLANDVAEIKANTENPKPKPKAKKGTKKKDYYKDKNGVLTAYAKHSEGEEMDDVLMHSKGPWKDHAYIKKYKNSKGKWVYVYAADSIHKQIHDEQFEAKVAKEDEEHAQRWIDEANEAIKKDTLHISKGYARGERNLALQDRAYYKKKKMAKTSNSDRLINQNSVGNRLKNKVNSIKKSAKKLIKHSDFSNWRIAKPDELMHSAKGTTWEKENHKYIEKYVNDKGETVYRYKAVDEKNQKFTAEITESQVKDLWFDKDIRDYADSESEYARLKAIKEDVDATASYNRLKDTADKAKKNRKYRKRAEKLH